MDDGTGLSRKMLNARLAWHYKKNNSDTNLAKLETEAKRLHRGLWIEDSPMALWVNKRLHYPGISQKIHLI